MQSWKVGHCILSRCLRLTEIQFSDNLNMSTKDLVKIVNEFGGNLKILNLANFCDNKLLAAVAEKCPILESFTATDKMRDSDFKILFESDSGETTNLCRTIRYFCTENSLTLEFIDSLLYKWALNLEIFLFWDSDITKFLDAVKLRSTQLKLKRVPEMTIREYDVWKELLHLLPCIEQVSITPLIAKNIETFHILDSLNRNLTNLTITAHCPLDWLFLVGKLFKNLKVLDVTIYPTSCVDYVEHDMLPLTRYYRNTDIDYSEIFTKLKEFKLYVMDSDYGTHNIPTYFASVLPHVKRIISNSIDCLECFEMQNYCLGNVNDMIGHFIGLNNELKLKSLIFNNCHKLSTAKIFELVTLKNPIEVLKVENCFSANTYILGNIRKYINKNNLNVDFVYS